MEKVRFGIVGLGNQGSYYTKGLFMQDKIKNGILSAVCDGNPARLDAIKEVLGDQDVGCFADFKEMLDSGLCDAVLITAPHEDHPWMVMECLKRGIHVVCEKPAGVYAKQVKEMNAFAADSKALFGMMFNQRTNCLYRKMKELIAAGELGQLQRITWIITNWFRTQAYYDSGSWRATWTGEGGGVLINQCPHQLDLVQWIVGELPEAVNGFCHYGKWHDIEVEDDVTAYLRYANGATGVFITTTGEAPGTNRLEISGTKGKLVCDGETLQWYRNDVDSMEFSLTAQPGFAGINTECIEVETDGKNPQHCGIINNFANAILGLEPLFVDGRDGLAGVELMNAIEYSGWLGGAEVRLPVDEDAYLAKLNEYRAKSKKKVVAEAAVVDTQGSFGTKEK